MWLTVEAGRSFVKVVQSAGTEWKHLGAALEAQHPATWIVGGIMVAPGTSKSKYSQKTKYNSRKVLGQNT